VIGADPQRAWPVGGGVLVVIGDAGLITSFPWGKPRGDGEGLPVRSVRGSCLI